MAHNNEIVWLGSQNSDARENIFDHVIFFLVRTNEMVCGRQSCQQSVHQLYLLTSMVLTKS